MRVLVVFLDGIGIGEPDPAVNPVAGARLDAIGRLLGDARALTSARIHATSRATLAPVDATLGVAGLPQSGTGQTALFTGINAAREFGRHFGPWVPTALRERLARENLLTKAKAAGRSVAFANAYPEELFAGGPARRRRGRGPVADPLRAGPPIVALGAGVLDRHTAQLARGDAVASEITNDGWRRHLERTELPVITAQQAGRNLARIAARHDLTLFAHYSLDTIGHTGHMEEAIAGIERVDAFLEGILAEMPADLLIAVVSDHGNIEDIRAGHTVNPALGLFIGAGHERFATPLALPDIAPRLLSMLA